MPDLAYYTILAVVLVVLAIVFFFAVDPMLGIFTVLLAQFSLKLEDRND